MKNHQRRPFRSLMFLLFAVLIGAFLLLPVSALLMAKQDVADAPANAEFPIRERLPEVRSTVPTASFAVPSTPVAPSPFGVAVAPNSQIARFSNADPMQGFVSKIRDAEDDDAKQEAIDQAQSALEKHYDKYIDAYEKQVDEMESRLQKLRDQLDKRKEAKDKLVGLKLEMITSQADGIGWPDATDRPNTQRFPSGTRTLWRTNPRTPALPSTPKEIPAPGAAVAPSDVYFQPATPFGTARQLALRSSPAGRLATTVGPQRPIAAKTSRKHSIAQGITASSSSLETAVFATFFERGIKLLETREYGEFLDRYLQPDEFRKELKSATLDEVSKEFADESAESILLMFRSAMENPVKTYDTKTESLVWETTTVDGEKKKLTLVRGEGDQWYLSFQNPDETAHQTR